MTIRKSDVLRMIEALPDDCTVEQIQYHLHVMRKIEVGLAACEAGQMISQEEMEQRVEGWLESSGPNPLPKTSLR